MVLSVIVGGAITSLVFCLIIFSSWRFSPEVWLSDVTEGAIKSPTGPAYAVMGSVLVTVLGGSTATAWWFASVYDTNFYERFIAAWLVIALLNLVDLLVVDLLVYIWIYPSWMRLEGVEPLHRLWPHVEGCLTGLTIGVPLAAIAAGLTVSI